MGTVMELFNTAFWHSLAVTTGGGEGGALESGCLAPPPPMKQTILAIKMDQPRPLFHLCSSFQTHFTNFTTNRYVKNVHPVYGAGI